MDTKLTTKSQQAISSAIQAASAAGNPQLEPIHVLAALLEQDGGVAAALTDAVRADRGVIGQRLTAAPPAQRGASRPSAPEPDASRAATQAASADGNPQLEPIHVLAALLEQDGGVAAALIDAVGADRGVIGQRVTAALATLPGASGSSVAQPQTSRAAMTMITDAGQE